jgi:phenylacetate-CoA ligase
MRIKIIALGATALLLKRYAGPFWLRRRWLEKTQWLSKQELQTLQLKLLRRLIQYAEHYVPYYQKLMKNRGLSSEDIRSLEDIKLFPIMTKQDVFTAENSILSRRLPKFLLHHAHTSGTTGTPLNIYRGLFSIGNEHAFVRRQFNWAGIRLSDRIGYLTGRLVVPQDQTQGKLYAYEPFMKELILSTFHLSKITAEAHIQAIKKFKIKAILGFPSALSFLANICLERDYSLSLKAVITTSETLTEPMRKRISLAFACPVYDFYGSAERVCYIFTCEKGSYHIQPEYGFTELIPIDNSGQCKVVSTGFWNTAMPFLRYELGDIVTPSNNCCSCGRAFPVIESISGRESDVITTPSGRIFGATLLTHILCRADHILESQFMQDQTDHMYIDYVPGELFDRQDYMKLQELIKTYLPSEINVDIRSVESIQRTSSGKIKPIISFLRK